MSFKPNQAKKPKVTIIMLTWNQLEDTTECLESLKKITYPNFKIMVIDQGSESNDAEIIQEKYPQIKVIKNRKNEGFCRGNNIGAKIALKENPDYLLFMNNDTTVEPDFLDKLIEFSERNPKVGIAGPLILNYYERDKVYSCGGRANKFSFDYQEYKFILKKPRTDLNFISGCAILVKKQVIDKVGLWDEDFFSYWEDTDWCLRAEIAGFKLACIPDSVIYHKVTRANKYLSKRYVYFMTRNNLLIAKKYAKGYQWPSIIGSFLMRRWLAYFFKLILTRNFSSLPMIFWGTWDFITANYGRGRL